MGEMKLGFAQKTFSIFLFFILLSFLLILLDNLGILSPLRGGVEQLVVTLKREIYSLKQQTKNNKQQSEKGEKEREIAVLESQIAVLKSENAAMRRLLGAPLPYDWRFTPARVIGLPSSESLQIDKGTAEGVKKGMAVVFENVLVGKVSRVSEHFSSVSPPSSPEVKILVLTRSSTDPGVKARGLLVGQGGKVNLERVLTQEALDEGDLVLTAGDEELPPDIPIGKVGKITKIEGEIYQKAEVKLLVEFPKLETVFVVISR